MIFVLVKKVEEIRMSQKWPRPSQKMQVDFGTLGNGFSGRNSKHLKKTVFHSPNSACTEGVLAVLLLERAHGRGDGAETLPLSIFLHLSNTKSMSGNNCKNLYVLLQ